MFRWIGITDTKNIPEIRKILDQNKITVEFMDAGDNQVRCGCPRLARKARWVLDNYGVKWT
jgi:hypothetical protein